MRTLSKSEKKVVKKICEKHQYFSDIFENDFYDGLIIEITNDSSNDVQEIKFLFKKEDNHPNEYYSKKMNDATEKIVQTINLLDYLKSEAYVFSFKPAHGFSVHGYIGLKEIVQDYIVNSDKYVGMQYPDFKTYDFIFEFIDIIFCCTEALKDYVKCGFKTKEQIRHRQNLFLAWFAVIVSALLGIIGIICK
jgi:hypothetical protein